MNKPSKQFEKDVYAFVKALDPSAEVFFNHKVPDVNTGTLRQVDVWINIKYGGQVPISILVSCKKFKRKLNITHIESFHSEVHSTGASTGIIYSSSGFTSSALKKAESFGLSCCRLFRNQPAELPTFLDFSHGNLSFSLGNYVCHPRIRMQLLQFDYELLKQKNITHWNELMNIYVTEDKTLLDHLVNQICEYIQKAIQQHSNNTVIPSDWIYECTFSPWNDDSFTAKIQLIGYWDIYHAKPECHLLNGAYCFSNTSFVGSVGTPSIDTYSNNPGPGWEKIGRNTISPTPIQSAFIFAMNASSLKQQLIDGTQNRLIERPKQ